MKVSFGFELRILRCDSLCCLRNWSNLRMLASILLSISTDSNPRFRITFFYQWRCFTTLSMVCSCVLASSFSFLFFFYCSLICSTLSPMSIGGPPEGNWWQLPHLKKLTRSKARVETHSKILCVRSIPSGGRLTPQSLIILFFWSMIFDEIL